MKNKDYTIRNMTRDELDIAIEWAKGEGWNPGLHDADVFWNTDPEGFIAMEIDGKMVGSGSIVSYDGKFGFMGFFIIMPEYNRSQGLGTKLWYYRRDKLLERLKPGAAIGMDGVFDMQDFYAKGGFTFAHRDLRMEGKEIAVEPGKHVEEITEEDFDSIHKLDIECFGFDRRKFLEGWLTLPDSSAMKYTKDGALMGYGVMRKCHKGYKIGPLFAENFDVADNLFRSLVQLAKGDSVYLDTPEVNKEALRLAKKYNMKECFGCARMYYGDAPDLPYDKIFGVTTFELG